MSNTFFYLYNNQFIRISNSFLVINSSTSTIPTADYYVATNGSDNYPGTYAQPFRTINKAYSLTVPGDLVYVRAGTYTEAYGGQWGMFGLNRNGSTNLPITLKAYPGETVVLDGQNINDNEHKLIFRLRCNYNIIDGFEITRAWEGPMSIEQSSNNNQIINCYIHHNGNQGDPSSGYGQGSIFSDTLTHDNLYASNVVSYNGRLTANNQLDHGFYICGDNETLRNNVITHNESWGIQIAGYTTVSNCKIYNNVMAFNGQGGIVIWQDVSTLDIKNNILYKNDHNGISTVGATGSGVVINNNSFYMNTGVAYDITPFSIGTGNITSDPSLVSETDYHLKSGSPCINAGTDVSLPYNGAAPDLGAFETT